jgi:Fuc2NAc and GlcNAc transferase
LLCALFTWLLSFPVQRELQRRQLLDHPNERSSHSVPTPRGGGIAIMAVLGPALIAIGIFQSEMVLMIIVVASLLLGAVSFLDDLKTLPASVRFTAQLLCAVLVLWPLGLFSSPFGNYLIITGIVLQLLWLVGYTNAFNFMDGINGISSIQAILTGLGTALIAIAAGAAPFDVLPLASAALAGAALGFMPHNFPSARTFMGDVGSAPLGFLLGALALWMLRDHGIMALSAVLLLHLNYILDTGITLLRRIARGERWWEPHREHFYQRLVRARKTHLFVTLSEAALQLVVMLLALLFLRVDAASRALIVLCVLAIWGLYFLYAERLFQASRAVSSRTLAPTA